MAPLQLRRARRTSCRAALAHAAAALLATSALLATAASAATPQTHPRPATIAALERALEGRGDWLGARLVGAAESDRVSVGEEIAFEFRSQRDAHLTVVHVDGEGNVTMLVPNQVGIGREIEANEPLRFPPGDSFGVELPIGPESVFAFATEEPLTPRQLGLRSFVDGLATLDPAVGPELAQCLDSHLPGADSSAAARLDYVVEDRTRGLPYTAESVEQYFGTVTRSFQRPTLDLLIHFDSGSAELDPEAQRRLDEVGKALSGSRLASFTFELNGHTDDVGDSDYNRDLSQRRAQAARGYLNAKYGIEPERLRALGHGEEKPKMPGTSRDARNMNRRVELELASRGTRSMPGEPHYVCGR